MSKEMTYNELTKRLIVEAEEQDDGYFEYAYIIARRLPMKLHEQLQQLINGPIWDGDILCKSHRDELFWYGLAVRVCAKGGTGHTGATYLAHTVMKYVSDIKEGKIG